MATQVVPGPIESGAVYPIADFRARTGLGTAALRIARREGLRVRYLAGRAFIRGEDFIRYLDTNAKDSK